MQSNHKRRFSTVSTILFADLGARIGGVKAAVPIHAGGLRAMLRAPTSFHDITPTGRIVARFSNDLFVVDTKLPELVADIIWIVCKVSPSKCG